jgi:hypothetical protein
MNSISLETLNDPLNFKNIDFWDDK